MIVMLCCAQWTADSDAARERAETDHAEQVMSVPVPIEFDGRKGRAIALLDTQPEGRRNIWGLKGPGLLQKLTNYNSDDGRSYRI